MKSLEQLGISPVPWHGWFGTQGYLGVCTENGNTVIAETYDFDCHDEENACRANTRLIAAAPELYEALRLCVHELCMVCRQETASPCVTMCETVCVAREALEKAGGAE